MEGNWPWVKNFFGLGIMVAPPSFIRDPSCSDHQTNEPKHLWHWEFQHYMIIRSSKQTHTRVKSSVGAHGSPSPRIDFHNVGAALCIESLFLNVLMRPMMRTCIFYVLSSGLIDFKSCNLHWGNLRAKSWKEEKIRLLFAAPLQFGSDEAPVCDPVLDTQGEGGFASDGTQCKQACVKRLVIGSFQTIRRGGSKKIHT